MTDTTCEHIRELGPFSTVTVRTLDHARPRGEVVHHIDLRMTLCPYCTGMLVGSVPTVRAVATVNKTKPQHDSGLGMPMAMMIDEGSP